MATAPVQPGPKKELMITAPSLPLEFRGLRFRGLGLCIMLIFFWFSGDIILFLDEYNSFRI